MKRLTATLFKTTPITFVFIDSIRSATWRSARLRVCSGRATKITPSTKSAIFCASPTTPSGGVSMITQS